MLPLFLVNAYVYDFCSSPGLWIWENVGKFNNWEGCTSSLLVLAMPPNPKVAKAFRAMRDLGISEEKVKPVLKNLLKLYDKNWDLIEEENYRALADAIFYSDEAEVES